MKIQYLGQMTFVLEIGEHHLMFDPFNFSNPKASHLPFEYEKIDYLFLSHAHGDHIADVDKIVEKYNPLIISNYELYTHFSEKGYNASGMNQGGKRTFEFGSVKLVHAIHSSSFPDKSYGGNPVGFVIESDEGNVYFAGDTALTMDMQLIPMMCNPIDLAILPIGDNFTMGYQDAALACEFVKTKKAIGAHYDTFPLITIDQEAAVKYFEERSLKLILGEPGTIFTL